MIGNTVAGDLGLSRCAPWVSTIDVGGVQFKVIGVLAAQGGVSFASVDSSVLVPLGAIEGRLVAFQPRHLADPRAGRAGRGRTPFRRPSRARCAPSTT